MITSPFVKVGPFSSACSSPPHFWSSDSSLLRVHCVFCSKNRPPIFWGCQKSVRPPAPPRAPQPLSGGAACLRLSRLGTWDTIPTCETHQGSDSEAAAKVKEGRNTSTTRWSLQNIIVSLALAKTQNLAKTFEALLRRRWKGCEVGAQRVVRLAPWE